MSSSDSNASEVPPAGEVERRVLAVVSETKKLPPGQVTADSTLEELGIDSLDRLNILFDLETAFDISINDEEARGVRTVREMVDGVRQLVVARGAAAAKPGSADGDVGR